MIEKVEQLLEHIRKEIADFSALDQYQMLQEIIQNLQDEADVQLHIEYMIKDDDNE